ncbi:MAG TPA: rod shape-determining protein MreD [Candidatus Ventricola intestinavium]|nr:rod shape-determining protein MreD [Candidatus Ventricola intestinavium]
MSRALRIVITAFVACICQTNLVRYIRIAGVAPDMLIVFLVLLTGYTGAYGGFCAGAVMAMLYDASVGYVLAINLVAYTFIGWAAPLLRRALDLKLRKFRHKSVLERMLICFFLTLMREILYIGYLFLIGAEQGLVTVMRMLLCAAYSALMILPGSVIMRLIMRAGRKKKKGDGDLNEDDVVTETQR